MSKTAYAFLTAGALLAAAPASAVDFISTYAITFQNGVSYAIPSPPRTAVGTYRDIFTFTVATPGSFSGSLTTQRLRADNGNGTLGGVISDLDFTSVLLDGGTPFQNPTPGTDAFETVRLPSTLLAAGTHMLWVDYTVAIASPDSAASYAGPLNFSPASQVPEPATWAFFIGGFGMVGAAMRKARRPQRIAVRFS